MSFTFVIGIVCCFVVLTYGIISADGSLLLFVDFPSMIVVFGGTICSMLVSYPAERLFKFKNLFLLCLFDQKYDYEERILTLISLSEKARREGLLSLEDDVSDLDDPFIKTGLQLVVDGTDPEIVRKVMEIEVEQMAARHDSFKRLFDDAASYAPSFGMIGTLMGLVMMLVNLQDKSKVGPYLAVAIITTFYGAVLAYGIFNPMATKLDQKTQEEVIFKLVTLEGIISIQAGENPRVIKDKLVMFLPYEIRQSISREVEK